MLILHHTWYSYSIFHTYTLRKKYPKVVSKGNMVGNLHSSGWTKVYQIPSSDILHNIGLQAKNLTQLIIFFLNFFEKEKTELIKFDPTTDHVPFWHNFWVNLPRTWYDVMGSKLASDFPKLVKVHLKISSSFKMIKIM